MIPAQDILDILLKKKYNRADPFQEEEIFKIIRSSLLKNEPIKLVGFWGAGSKNKIDSADQKSCKLLNNLNDEIKNLFSPGIEFTFIFATLHAEHNGYTKTGVNLYIDNVKSIFKNYGFKYVMLDDLWKKYNITFEKIDSLLEARESGWWNKIPNKELIEKNAAHRNKRYSPQAAAQKYYVMRELEKKVLEKEFAGYIFHVFSGPKLHPVLPNMPTLYFWGTKRWHSDAPWFILNI